MLTSPVEVSLKTRHLIRLEWDSIPDPMGGCSANHY